MDQARERLTQASHKLAEKMYSKANPKTQPAQVRMVVSIPQTVAGPMKTRVVLRTILSGYGAVGGTYSGRCGAASCGVDAAGEASIVLRSRSAAPIRPPCSVSIITRTLFVLRGIRIVIGNLVTDSFRRVGSCVVDHTVTLSILEARISLSPLKLTAARIRFAILLPSSVGSQSRLSNFSCTVNPAERVSGCRTIPDKLTSSAV